MATTRERNREIGRRYDARPYDPRCDVVLDPDYLLIHAGDHGRGARDRAAVDVLDLGCGHGGQLARAGERLRGGRLVGADISAAACARARARLAHLGDRARIVECDLLDLEAAALGVFDLIYVIGTFYTLAPEVRAHVAALIRGCLAPRGVVVVSHYAGDVGRARAAQVAAVRAGAAPPAADDDVIAFELLSPWLDAHEPDELAAALGLRWLEQVDGPRPGAGGGYTITMFGADDQPGSG